MPGSSWHNSWGATHNSVGDRVGKGLRTPHASKARALRRPLEADGSGSSSGLIRVRERGFSWEWMVPGGRKTIGW